VTRTKTKTRPPGALVATVALAVATACVGDPSRGYPVIFLGPNPGATVTSPVRVHGTAVVFEATFRIEVVQASTGRVLSDDMVMASTGAPERGTFDVTLRYGPAQRGVLLIRAYELSAKDGSKVVLATLFVNSP